MVQLLRLARRRAAFSFVFMAVEHIFPAVPPHHREAEAGTSDLDIRPIRSAASGKEFRDPLPLVNKHPLAIAAPADQRITRARHAKAIRTPFGDDRLGPPVAVEIFHLLDGSGRVACRARIPAALPLLALKGESGRSERSSLIGRRE